MDDLGAGCDILIATPGRLCDLMDKPHVLTMTRVKSVPFRHPQHLIRSLLNQIRYTVIDEADEMLDADWEEELKKILSGGGALLYRLLLTL